MKYILIQIMAFGFVFVSFSFKKTHPDKIFLAYCLVYTDDSIVMLVQPIKAENKSMAQTKFNNIIKASFRAGSISIRCYTLYEIINESGDYSNNVSNGYEKENNKKIFSDCN